MAQLYGNRWRILGDLGQGGQSDVFRVRDESGQILDECALKRVRNPKRRERFLAEVAAITRLRHRNVVQLLDHSALESSDAERQFLVMPLARGGNLAERAAMFAGSLDSVLITARQIAAALAVAHAGGVVHRDVKPENILFADQANHPLLSDFGICLLSERERSTASDEVVGPWAFMAPELEGGGRLEVSGSADVYSLGKLVYYMLSGGKILPRERLNEAPYAGVFEKGERHRLLRILLGKTLEPSPDKRIALPAVIADLEAIESWEERARLAPLTSAASAAISRIRDREIQEQQVTQENQRARLREGEKIRLIKESIGDWLRVELEVAASTASSPGLVECAVREPKLGEHPHLSLGRRLDAQILSGIELTLRRPRDPFEKTHAIRLLLCCVREFQISFGGQTRPAPERDLELLFVPYYYRYEKQTMPNNIWQGFLSCRKAVGSRQSGLHHVAKSFMGDEITLIKRFHASEWPGVQSSLGQVLLEALEVFVDYVESGASSMGA